MSGAPKRLHEEGAHSATSKRAHEDNIVFSSVSGKLIPPGKNDYHLSSEVGSDGRMTKIPRLESRDDSRLWLDRVFRVPSPANGSCLDHSGASESRLDHRDSKDSRDSKPDTRETKAELRELYTENRMDTPISKGENSVRPETRGNDKDTRSEREFRSDAKNEGKLVRDSAALSFHLSTKDPKEHQKTKRYQESSTDGLDQWHTAHHNIQNTDETGKEIRIQEGRESWEVHGTVVDSKSELKGEEKSKENERKKKDEKYKDWGEREKDRNDRHNNLHLGSSGKEFFREDRDSERWERERKESQINKEWKDRDKDSMKKSSLNVNDKETLRNEKNPIDSVLKTSEEEATASEVKKTKEFDNWKAGDRDNKDRKRDRDQDAEVDRHDKRNRAYDKESDDGCVEGDGFGERDREAFSYGIQQRRRMLRQRGSSQATQREPRLRSRSREIEGSQEKPEVSSIVYKVGECMQELLKAWKEFEATHDSKEEAFQNGPTLEIRIPAEHVTATNRQVRGGQMWGTDFYTDDSDIVAVLMHTGYCRPTASSPPPAVHELRATIRVLPPQDCYTSTLRNNVRSRAWGAGISCSYRVEKCCIVKKGGGTIDLEPRLNHISAVEPTLAPVSVERTMTTRAAASNALRQQRFLREVTVQYNLCNEPWLKYSINVVADKGLKKPLYTSARLKKGEVLYLETHFNRYELCFNGERSVSNSTAASVYSAHESGQEKPQHHSTQFVTGDRNVDNIVDLFRWSRCKKPLPQKTMRSIGIPLPVEHLEVLEENLDWEDVQWSQTGVWIAAKEYVLARVHFLSSS